MSIEGTDPQQEKLFQYLKRVAERVAVELNDTRAGLREREDQAREPFAIGRRRSTHRDHISYRLHRTVR
jgi:hypothetical protein